MECYISECHKHSDEAPGTAPGEYGALAFDEESGAYGLADASPDKESARQSALRYCGQHGPSCRIVDSFKSKCAAFSQNTTNAVAWGIGGDMRSAMRQAMKRCGSKSDGKSGCHVTLHHCY